MFWYSVDGMDDVELWVWMCEELGETGEVEEVEEVDEAEEVEEVKEVEEFGDSKREVERF